MIIAGVAACSVCVCVCVCVCVWVEIAMPKTQKLAVWYQHARVDEIAVLECSQQWLLGEPRGGRSGPSSYMDF